MHDATGRVVFYAPVTTGSEHDPLPIGEWKVNGVQFNPTFRYNPDLFWDADPGAHESDDSRRARTVRSGWCGSISRRNTTASTARPSRPPIGRTESHGCVRLTNWDALRLAGLVKPGTRVVFAE